MFLPDKQFSTIIQEDKMKQHEVIYDARQLGTGKTLILGLQHMFAMFGATVLVPIITSEHFHDSAVRRSCYPVHALRDQK